MVYNYLKATKVKIFIICINKILITLHISYTNELLHVAGHRGHWHLDEWFRLAEVLANNYTRKLGHFHFFIESIL